jgi:hypothetical protein
VHTTTRRTCSRLDRGLGTFGSTFQAELRHFWFDMDVKLGLFLLVSFHLFFVNILYLFSFFF